MTTESVKRLAGIATDRLTRFSKEIVEVVPPPLVQPSGRGPIKTAYKAMEIPGLSPFPTTGLLYPSA
jgi:hypothetical protein